MSNRVTVVVRGAITNTEVVYTPNRDPDAYVDGATFVVDTTRPGDGARESFVYPLENLVRAEILELDDS